MRITVFLSPLANYRTRGTGHFPQGFMTADLSHLFEQYYASLVRMLYRRTGDRDRAEDLAQETFARAVAAPPNNPRPWLFAVALNLVREDGRRAATRGDAGSSC